ncbi:TPA: hypothetical protein ACGOX2_001102 [Streptococcus suis]
MNRVFGMNRKENIMKNNTRKNFNSTLIFILLFVLFQLWGNSRADILQIINHYSGFSLQVLS